MLLRKFSVPSRRKPLQKLEVQCDHCGRRFVTNFSSGYESQPQHFCSCKCSQAEHRELCTQARVQPDVVAKQQATVLARFGVKSVLSLPEVHFLANTPEKCRQRHETMKRNGSYFNSKSEDAFYEWLVLQFGNVERQVVVNKWPIDFYVKSIDTYVQFDGEYWHGLDRSLEEIMRFKTPRDRTILLKYQIDRRQDEWFHKNNLKLIRVTDKQFKAGQFTV